MIALVDDDYSSIHERDHPAATTHYYLLTCHDDGTRCLTYGRRLAERLNAYTL